MHDPSLSLTFNLQAHKGTYALLLGSGMSRSAGILTGWEVTLDLVRQVAHAKGEPSVTDPEDWYRRTFGAEPNYSEILTELCPTSAAQQLLLNKYFEPTPAEIAAGRKLPTAAHKAIAELVRAGYVRVIVTTNFDRLMETALVQAAVTPVVIDSPDDIEGAPPLVHSACTIFKIHGDYKDGRIKNSPAALAEYDAREDRLLDQILDEYGLVVCGWSADYDTALRNAFARARSRRYPMFWATRSEPSAFAQALIQRTKASVIRITDADTFFEKVNDTLKALDTYDRPHPLTTAAAVATLESYLVEERHRIRLRQLLLSEAEKTRLRVKEAWETLAGAGASPETVQTQLRRLEAATETLCALFASGSFHCSPQQVGFFLEAFRVLSGVGHTVGGRIWERLQYYPLLLLIFSAGVGAFASNNMALVGLLATSPTVRRNPTNPDELAVDTVFSEHLLDKADGNALLHPNDREYLTPFSDYLCDRLREMLTDLRLDQVTFERAFDMFEFMWGLELAHINMKKDPSRAWVPLGSFAWRSLTTGVRVPFDCLEEVRAAWSSGNSSWPPLKAGMCGGTVERLKQVSIKVQEHLKDRLARGMR